MYAFARAHVQHSMLIWEIILYRDNSSNKKIKKCNIKKHEYSLYNVNKT